MWNPQCIALFNLLRLCSGPRYLARLHKHNPSRIPIAYIFNLILYEQKKRKKKRKKPVWGLAIVR